MEALAEATDVNIQCVNKPNNPYTSTGTVFLCPLFVVVHVIIAKTLSKPPPLPFLHLFSLLPTFSLSSSQSSRFAAISGSEDDADLLPSRRSVTVCLSGSNGKQFSGGSSQSLLVCARSICQVLQPQTVRLSRGETSTIR